MRPGSGFWMAAEWIPIGKKDDVTICRHEVIVNFFNAAVSLVKLLVQVSRQYHDWYWCCHNFCL